MHDEEVSNVQRANDFPPRNPSFDGRKKWKWLDQVRWAIRVAHYAIRTEEADVDWIRRFILSYNKRHPSEMGAAEITDFLTHLAVEGKVTVSTQNQALSGLLYLYQQVLKIELPLINAVRATASVRLPVVLSVMEVRRLLASVPDGTYRLMIELMYGSGLRLLESCRLRVKDIDFERQQILVREGRGDKDRAVPLPERLSDRLQRQIDSSRQLHRRTRKSGDTGASRLSLDPRRCGRTGTATVLI